MNSKLYKMLILTALFLIFISCNKDNSAEETVDRNIVMIETSEVSNGIIEKNIQMGGEVAAQGVIRITPDTNGLLKNILVKPGDYVFYDQIIAWVDPSRPGLVYALSPVRSKLEGTVTNVLGIAGNQVSPQVVIAEVGDLDNLEIVCKVPERYLSYLKLGLLANVTSRAFPEEIKQANIIEISPVVDPLSRTVDITLLPGSHNNIRPGQSVLVELILETHKDVIIIPEASITERYGDRGVFIIQDDVANWRIVKTGLRKSGYIEIIDGLKVKELFAVAGVNNLTDGITVNILND